MRRSRARRRAQRRRGVPHHWFNHLAAGEVEVGLHGGDAGEVLEQLLQEIEPPARVAGHEREVGVDGLVQMVVVDAVDDAIGEHRHAERRAAQLAGEVVEPARLVEAIVRGLVRQHRQAVLAAGDADQRRGEDQRMRPAHHRGDAAGDQRPALDDRQRGAQRIEAAEPAHLGRRQPAARLDAKLLARPLVTRALLARPLVTRRRHRPPPRWRHRAPCRAAARAPAVRRRSARRSSARRCARWSPASPAFAAPATPPAPGERRADRPGTGTRRSSSARSMRSSAPVSVELPSASDDCSSPMVMEPSLQSVARICPCTADTPYGLSARLCSRAMMRNSLPSRFEMESRKRESRMRDKLCRAPEKSQPRRLDTQRLSPSMNRQGLRAHSPA